MDTNSLRISYDVYFTVYISSLAGILFLQFLKSFSSAKVKHSLYLLRFVFELNIDDFLVYNFCYYYYIYTSLLY